MDNKFKFIENVRKEFEKRKKFAVYHLPSDTIIVDSDMHLHVPTFLAKYQIKKNIGEIVDEMILVDNSIKDGWRHVIDGKIHKDCNLKGIYPTMFNLKETDIIFNTYLNIQETQTKSIERNEQYIPLIIKYGEFEEMNSFFTYLINNIPFHLTLQQYKAITNSMDYEKFTNIVKLNLIEKLYDEFKYNKRKGFLDSNKDVYIIHLNNIFSRSFIFGASYYFDVIKDFSGFETEKIYAYVFSESEVAFFRGNISGNYLLEKIEQLDSLERNKVYLEPFEITRNHCGTIKFAVEPNIPLSHS